MKYAFTTTFTFFSICFVTLEWKTLLTPPSKFSAQLYKAVKRVILRKLCSLADMRTLQRCVPVDSTSLNYFNMNRESFQDTVGDFPCPLNCLLTPCAKVWEAFRFLPPALLFYGLMEWKNSWEKVWSPAVVKPNHHELGRNSFLSRTTVAPGLEVLLFLPLATKPCIKQATSRRRI